jgi:type VI secretion system VasD/TssJ family lipoprotein
MFEREPTLPGRRGAAAALVLLGLLLLAAGCASTDKITLTSSPRLNACGGSDGHPVVIRIYYLRGTSRFARADFSELWENDHAVLADDRLEVHERTLKPQEQIVLSLERKDATKEATAIGLVANFCEPGEGCWRRLIPITGRTTETRIHADEGCLSID